MNSYNGFDGYGTFFSAWLTWNLSLWLDSEYSTYALFQEYAREYKTVEALADVIEEYVQELINEYPSDGFIADVLGYVLRDINYLEVAEHILSE